MTAVHPHPATAADRVSEHRQRPRVDFIVGMARSGTTWLGSVLSEHPDLAVFGETSFWGRLYVPPRADGLYGAAELGKVLAIQKTRDWCTTTGAKSSALRGTGATEYERLVEQALAAIDPPVAPAEAFLAITRAVARSEGKNRVVEKTPHHVHWLERIAETFPDARFVITVRDPYGFVVSLRHLGSRIDARTKRILDLPWRHPLVAALGWRAYATSVEKAVARYGARIMLVRTSELEGRPREALRNVQSFLGVDVRALPVDRAVPNSSFQAAPRPPLRAEDVFWLKVVAGRAIASNGYEIGPVPRAPLRIVASVALVPFVAPVVALRLRGMVAGSLRDYLSRWLGR